MADEATLRIVVQDASVGQSPPPDDAPPLTPYQSAPTPSFSQQAPPANAYQSQPPVSTPRAAPRPSSPADDPYEQARRLRESQIQREQVKAAYDQMYGTAEKANSIFDGVLDAAQKMRGTLGGVFGPLVGALLDIYAATREAKREDGNAIRAEAERRNLLKPEMVFQRQADVAIQQKRQEETTPTSVGPIQSDTIMAEAREALLALGNSQIEADKLLRQVMDNANATFATVQDVIRAAYQNKGASAASATQPQAASTPMPANTTPVPTPPPIKKASGGEVPIVGGIPASADEVPIKATAGEFVVRKDEAQKPANKSMLQAMNSGMDVASHFATGGEIPSREENFKKWFGDSKVVDDEGRPLTVYHGTQGKFDAFDPNRKGARDSGDYGKGFYFTQSKANAQMYAEWAKGGGAAKKKDQQIISANLSIQNPFVMADEMSEDTALRIVSDASANRVRLGKEPLPNHEDHAKKLLDQFNNASDTVNKTKERARVLSSYISTEGLSRLGFDGVIGTNEIVAFNPTQIKSTTNEGAYDPNDPRIHKATGGEIGRLPKFDDSGASHFATGGEIPQIDPFEKHFDVLKSEAMGFPGEQKWKHVPHDAELFAAGAEAQVFRQPNADEIYRVQSNSGYGDPIDYRPNIEPLLQPTAQKKLDDNGRTSLVERMPFAPNFPQVMMTMPEPTRFEDTPSQIWEGVVTDIKQRLDDSGYEYRDLNPRNVGFRDGKWYIVDPGGLKKKSGDGEIQSRNRLPHFAAGGVIPPSPNVSPHSDNVPIAATAGEYVVTRDAASRPENRQALDNMNRGAAPTPQAQPDIIDLIMKSIVNPMIGVREMEPWSLESTQLRVLASVDAMRANRESPTPSNPNMPSVPNVSPASDNPISIVPSANVAPPSSANAIPVARTATAGIARGPLPVAATATTANAAGMAGMAAKAVPVLGTVVVVAEALAKVFGALNSAVNETVTKYADLNPAVAQAQARAEMTAIFGDIRRANEAAPQLTRYIEVQSRLQQQYEDAKMALLKKFMDIATPIMDLLDKILPPILSSLRVLDSAVPLLELIASVAQMVADWLPQQNQPAPFEDPVDIILNRPEQIQMPPNVGG